MAKYDIGRVQGVSCFYCETDASSLVLSRSLVEPTDVCPFTGDMIIDNTGSMYRIITVSSTDVTLELKQKLNANVELEYVTDEEIAALFTGVTPSDEDPYATDDDIRNLFN